MAASCWPIGSARPPPSRPSTTPSRLCPGCPASPSCTAFLMTRGLLREAGLSLSPIAGTRWSVEHGVFSRRDDDPEPHEERLHQALAALDADIPIAAFLRLNFGAPEYSRMRRNIERMVEGYDA